MNSLTQFGSDFSNAAVAADPSDEKRGLKFGKRVCSTKSGCDILEVRLEPPLPP